MIFYLSIYQRLRWREASRAKYGWHPGVYSFRKHYDEDDDDDVGGVGGCGPGGGGVDVDEKAGVDKVDIREGERVKCQRLERRNFKNRYFFQTPISYFSQFCFTALN